MENGEISERERRRRRGERTQGINRRKLGGKGMRREGGIGTIDKNKGGREG